MRNIMQIFTRLLNIWLIAFAVLVFAPSQTDGPSGNEIRCDQPLTSPSHQFPSGSRANDVRTILRYNEKPYWPMQWYMSEEQFLVKKQIYSPSMKIAELHNINVKGQDVRVIIIGNSPVNCKHQEIREHCFSDSPSYSYYAEKPRCTWNFRAPKKCQTTFIQTAVAGIIGMKDEGQNCGVGIAPKCSIGSIVIEPSSKSGSPEHCAAKVLSSSDKPHPYVFVHTWSFSNHDYKRQILHALGDVTQLNFDPKRQNQMSPHVMGSGDHGLFANSCQCNEYANADSMFVFGSVAYNGYATSYSETCASLIGVTYSASDGNAFYNNIITITDSDNESPTYAPKNTTTVSAAIGGGIIALISQMFVGRFRLLPTISDFAFLLAFSSTSVDLRDKNTLWFTNGVGLAYSPQAGFGLPDMTMVFTLLRDWIPMGTPVIYEFSRFTRSLTYMYNLVCPFQIFNSLAYLYIQLITVELSAKIIMKRGALTVYLISPAGTVSCILEGRPYDIQKKNYKKLLLRTNHFIGETMRGVWSIRFYFYKEDSKPTYNELYSFPTVLQRTTLPPISPVPDAKRRTPTSPIGTTNSDPGKSSANLPLGSEKRASSQATHHRTQRAHHGYQDSSEPNIIDEINFRFLLVESLPSVLEVKQSKKSTEKEKFDFELMKAWVDFRHYLLVQTDPKQFGTSSVGLWEVYEIMNYFIEELLVRQNNSKFDDPMSSILPHQLQKLLGPGFFSSLAASEVRYDAKNQVKV